MPRRPHGIALKPTQGDGISAKRHRLDHIGAAANTAIDNDLRPAANLFDDFGQDLDAAAAVIQLAATVIGHINSFDPQFDRTSGVLGGGDSFQGQGNVVGVLEPLDLIPA